MKYEIAITPAAKPRMTKQDKWKKRAATTAYWSFKDSLSALCADAGYRLENRLYAVFYIEMPQSWSEKKKKLMDGTKHEARPDADNFLKGIMDCLRPDGDSMVTPACGHKVWCREPKIVFFNRLKDWYDFVVSLGHDI